MELSRRAVLNGPCPVTTIGIGEDVLMLVYADLAKALPKRAGRLILAP